MKFRINWHHRLICDVVQDVIEGRRKNVVINISPGSSKTELVIINFIARGLALNPRARFLHLSYSDDLALLNSQTARDIIQSDEYQKLWPIKISDDTKSKKRWNVEIDGKLGGGVYATSLAGQITGFRAGHMVPGWQGAILIDDPNKSDDAFSKKKLADANRKLLSTVKSRKANPDTPIVIIMQRIAEEDVSGFVKQGNLGKDWSFVLIPAILDEHYFKALTHRYQEMMQRDDTERFSYWPYKEPIQELLEMESGTGKDQAGNRMSRQIFSGQYMQNPTSLGGNLIRSEWFNSYSILPKLKYRKIYSDTAQKTAEHNDYSCFLCAGLGEDGKLYLIDMLLGKFEAPELERRCIAFWHKHANKDAYPPESHGQLRQLVIELKSSGTGLFQKIKLLNHIPIKGLERNKDKLTRLMDVLGYIESGYVCLPREASFTHGLINECESFTSDQSHAHDDQIDCLIDALVDLVSASNKLAVWQNLI